MNWIEWLFVFLGLALLLRLLFQVAQIREEQFILRQGLTDCFDQVFKTLERIEDQLPEAQRRMAEAHQEAQDLLMEARFGRGLEKPEQ